MLIGYKIQDDNKGRVYNADEYTDCDWVISKFKDNNHCLSCKALMGFDKNSNSKVTVDRI